MIFRQFFDSASSNFTYFLASEVGGEALIIDPVKEQQEQYCTLMTQLSTKLVYAIDTHIHADHITALADLQRITNCKTVMSVLSKAEGVTQSVKEGEMITIKDIVLKVLFTPGHTQESISLVLDPNSPKAVFTGDLLLIRGTGRTDFQGGSAQDSWNSIVNKLFKLPDSTTLYPGHDYKGWTASSIGEERQFNPRIAHQSEQDYENIMNHLNLPRPKMMDVAVPANLKLGLSFSE